MQQILLHGIVTPTTHTTMNTAVIIDDGIQQQQQDLFFSIDRLSSYQRDVMIQNICIACISVIQQQQIVIVAG